MCLSVGSVPVIMASEDLGMKLETFLPFNQVLEWGRVIIMWRIADVNLHLLQFSAFAIFKIKAALSILLISHFKDKHFFIFKGVSEES